MQETYPPCGFPPELLLRGVGFSPLNNLSGGKMHGGKTAALMFQRGGFTGKKWSDKEK
jgi:hypothetical protein